MFWKRESVLKVGKFSGGGKVFWSWESVLKVGKCSGTLFRFQNTFPPLEHFPTSRTLSRLQNTFPPPEHFLPPEPPPSVLVGKCSGGGNFSGGGKLFWMRESVLEI